MYYLYVDSKLLADCKFRVVDVRGDEAEGDVLPLLVVQVVAGHAEVHRGRLQALRRLHAQVGQQSLVIGSTDRLTMR